MAWQTLLDTQWSHVLILNVIIIIMLQWGLLFLDKKTKKQISEDDNSEAVLANAFKANSVYVVFNILHVGRQNYLELLFFSV